VLSVLRGFFASLVLAVLGAGIASAQAFDFKLLAIPANGNPATIANGQTINLVAPNVGAQVQVTIVATYIGTTEATIAAAPTPLGSTEITLVTVPAAETFPLVLTPGQTFTFIVKYTASNASQVSAQVTIPYTEPGTGSTGSVGVISNSISLLFQGLAPSFTLFYFITPANGSTPNVLPLAPGGTIPFPATQLNTTATGGLQIYNVGSGPGAVTGISLVSGAPFFQLAGIPPITPAVPYTITPGTSTDPLTIGILYTPTAVETDKGQVQVTYQDGTTALINLMGSGATSSYSYSYLSGTTSTPVQPGGTIVLPAVPVATTGTTPGSSKVIVTVTNKGNGNGTINSINANGPFTVSGVLNPPPVLKPGDSEGFTITYTPTAVGPQTGALQVGNDTFTLTGTGGGTQLAFSYSSNGATIPITGNTGVVFPAIAVGKTENVMFTVMNSGTVATTVTLVTASPTPPFSVPALPPTNLAAGQSTSFPITFAPTTVSPVNGSLSVNGTGVPLFGAGSAPPALPSYTITGPSGNVSPASQENISLTLAKSYPVDLNGVLTLTTSGNFGTDSAVQFSTGSSTGNRTVDFEIPANGTSANFVGQGSQILLQTGTVAETVTLTPSFATTAGVDVTPASPTTLQFTIASLAPVLESLQVTNTTASSFTLLIIGYSTPRSLGSLNVTFNPATGYNFTTTTFTSDLSQNAALWFQSAAALAFGGQFEVTIPFNLTGPVANGKTLLQAIASISATVSNSVGTSNSRQANVQ
jgi:hypothetical protein